MSRNNEVFTATKQAEAALLGAILIEASVGSRDVDKVGAVHILRHSGAVERLKQTGNPKAVQDQLRHKSALMTMRYLKTLSADESFKDTARC